MMKFTTRLKKTGLIALSVVLLNIPTAAVFADNCPAPASGNGVHSPTGSDASTYTYQCSGQYAGEWTNPYYVYNPATSSRTPLYDPQYAYDCSTNQWTMLWWSYSPAQSSFYSSRIPADTTPNQPTNCSVASAPAASGSGTTSTAPAASGSSGAINGSANSASQQALNNTGPGSSNSATSSLNGNANSTNTNTLGATNNLTAQSNTGNASVSGNTVGGSALTGDATSIANIANLLQSTSNVFGPDLASFVANINGDVNGDFMFDPSAIIGDSGPGSNNTANNTLQVNTNNANTTDAQINNNVTVGATSGNAAVSGNTNGGDATSGDANAIVNLMNLINSTISSGKSFIGTININGNLNGDILLPQDFVNQLLANTGPGSNNTANAAATNNDTTSNTSNENINNAINSTATTGSANAANNTTAGSASSGSAGTNVTLLNLTGSQVAGKNDLLVFVNVLGHWVGMIVNAPAGTTSAELGGGISSSGPNSNNTTNNSLTTNSTTTNNTNLGINNNVNVNAKSGDATVADNTAGGNAKTGNADTAVNILNLTGSNLDLSDWFGVLFINVFGNWTGSFGVNTSAGNPVATTSATGTTGGPAQVAQFVPTASGPTTTNPLTSSLHAAAAGLLSGSTSGSSSDGAVLAAKTAKILTKAPTVATISSSQKAVNHFVIPVIGISLALLILLAGERKRFGGSKT